MTPYLVLAIAVLAISTAGPLVRLSGAHPVAIAAWRLFFALVVIGAVVLVRGSWRQWRTLSRRELFVALGAGVLLALHFWSWNASIQLTTVAASVVLVNMQAVFAALISWWWLREPPSTRQWIGIGIALVGAAVVAGPDAFSSDAASGRALIGDALALLGGATAAIYFVSGRRLRDALDLWAYVALVYGACFVVLVIIAQLIDIPLIPQPPRELAIFAGLAVGPMLLGHTGFNWALRFLPAYVVTLTILGEVVGATLLAAVLPGIREIPTPLTIAGGALVLAGILVTARAERRNPAD